MKRLTPQSFIRCARSTAWAAVTAGAVGGCVEPPYHWAMVNHSSQDLGIGTRVTCMRDGRMIVLLSGIMPHGSGVSESDVAVRPLPDVVRFHWNSGTIMSTDGVAHDIDVPVHGHVFNEAQFSDVLCLEFTDGGVKLRPETEDELDNGPQRGRPATRP